MYLATIAGHLAFGLIAFSFLVKDILWLRVVSVVASLFSILYNYTVVLLGGGWRWVIDFGIGKDFQKPTHRVGKVSESFSLIVHV